MSMSDDRVWTVRGPYERWKPWMRYLAQNKARAYLAREVESVVPACAQAEDEEEESRNRTPRLS